ncbi:PepSY-associated TM helix domain-containing protein [Mucilaginibacter defluvii]|uniref:PepSY-associated TM helix domain-containing protein n=1 Tax=Mucilaginibacter defluvii TaxID=1196019 RepID=A0ABP9FMB8_9SPHI
MAAKKNFKYWIGKMHLWLGLASGLLVCFLGITGCILAFEREIEDATQAYRFSQVQNKPVLPPSKLKEIANTQIKGKEPHSINYQTGRSAMAVYYGYEPKYYYIVFMNPYTGQVLRVKDMNQDFFRIVIDGHFYLWLPPKIGQPIVATGTLMFLFLLISGVVLWWPKNRAATKQRFSIKWNAKWRRVNYDLHNVLGFYMTWVIIFIAITGLVWGFQWFAKSMYWVTSGGKSQVQFTESLSDTTKMNKISQNAPPTDILWARTNDTLTNFKGSMDVHFPENNKASIEIAVNPDPYTYWQADYRFYDQYTLEELPVKHIYGRLAKASTADKIARMNYDIHVGAVAGLAGKIAAFFGSLICASMPVTGFIIWWGRRNKAKKPKIKKARITEMA